MRPTDNQHVPGSDMPDVAGVGGFVAFCVRQIEAAMEEAFRDLDKLSVAVFEADRASSRILARRDSGETATDGGAEGDRVDIAALQYELSLASVQLQALDRLQQRLGNSCGNLARAGELMNSLDLPIQKEGWQEFLREVRLAYTTPDERRTFDRHYDGASAADKDSPDGDSVTDPILF